ncbi:hypothetical protein [Massilia alkalitolerans]|uniref:hypothetical protein n=1 Tax=Massilia alkalitolerans TaxID=286638 RepID=UPI0028B1FD72|nr:hypothetical protein [Massilia alkalitolerans]
MENPSRRQARPGFVEQGELFEHHLTAVFPSPDSQPGIALASLIKAERLRQADWLHVGWRLAAAIDVLKTLGWPVISLPVAVAGRKRPIAEYSLPTWVLRAIGGAK